MTGVVEAPSDPVDAFTPYHHVRFREARDAGLTKAQARRFATGKESLHTLRKLRKDGCDPQTLARIVT